MGTLIHQIAALSLAQYGVNILEVAPPGSIRGVGTNIVAIVGAFPWGPIDTVTEVTSTGELFDAICPVPFDALDDYPAMKAFINKTFPNTIKVVRVSPSGQVKATKNFDDSTPGGQQSVTVTARYFGALGNSISIAWAANADDATARDMTVTIGTAYSKTYPNVATIVSAALVVTDPGDPYVTVAAASGTPTLVPAAIAATALAGGADGTPVAGDYSTAIDVFSDVNVAWDVIFLAEVDSSIRATVNETLQTFMDANKRGVAVMCSIVGETSTAAKTSAAGLRSDRCVYVWPEVYTVNTYDPDRAETLVDGNSFAAAAIASVDPWISPGGAPGAPFLAGISRLSLPATFTTLNDLNDNGISPWYISTALGPILHGGFTTSLTSGLERIARRRVTDYLMNSISQRLEFYVGRPLDIDIDNETLGPVTGPEIGEIRTFLQNEKAKGHIKDWAVDPFSANVEEDIDDGIWVILIEVETYSAQEKIVLQAAIGETVQITQAA